MPDAPRAMQELVARLREPGLMSRARPAGLVEGPASACQEQFWLMDQVDPDSHRCLLPEAMMLKGPLDAAALRRAFESLVARHAVLRTAFRLTDDNALWQTVRAQPPLRYEYRDERGRANVDWLEVVSRELATIASRSFDLERAETLRINVVRIGDDEHVLVYVVHHAVFDEASFAIVRRELAELYTAAAGRRPVALPPLRTQYVDFAVEQRAGRALSAPRSLAYWRGRLAGLRQISIGTYDAAGADGSPSSSERYLDLDGDLTSRVRDVARKHGVWSFMVYLSGYLVLLSRLSGATDIAVTTPVSSRCHAELEGLVGCFVDTVAVRMEIGEHSTFSALVRSVTSTCLEAFEHQDIAISDLYAAAGDVTQSDVSSSLAYSFIYHHDPGSGQEQGLAGLRIVGPRIEVGYAKAELALTVRDGGPDPVVRVQFDRSVHSASTALHAGRAYIDLLRAAVSAPDVPLSTHPDEPSRRPSGPSRSPSAVLAGSDSHAPRTRHSGQRSDRGGNRS